MTRPSARSIAAWLLAAVLAPAACAPPELAPPPPVPPEAPDLGEAMTPVASRPFTPPYGATVDGDVLRFVVRSRRATRIELSIFARPRGEPARLTRRLAQDGDRFTTTVSRAELAAAGVTDVVYYGYRAWGPNWPFDPAWQPGSEAGFITDVDEGGNRFNPNKLLFDPYALELSHDPVGDWAPYGVGKNRARDSALVAPKGIVLADVALDTGPRPGRALADDVIYEVHLRGLTRGDRDADPTCAGTYRAAGERAQRLAELGVTVVEFLPIHETNNEGNDLAVGTSGDNYWGYSSLSFFAPDRRYACDQRPGGPTRELAEMVRAFHAQGIKVFLDVVYNHTAEGSGSSLLSLRGLDNASYYEVKNDGGGFVDNNGVGANLNATDEVARDLVLDSLKYYARSLGIDGFRFDLAPVLGNTCAKGCFRYDAGDAKGILRRAAAELDGVTLIAEPWGIGAGTYQLGAFPPGWSEWNGRFRDTIRRHQNKLGVEPVSPGWLVSALSGSPDLFKGRTPAASINFVVAHDGFTLRDLYACNAKNNNQPWPFGPSDGGEDHNLSWDQGGDPVRQLRAVRTGLVLLVVSAGIPMITGGDEMLRSLRCNNNPYNLDSEANWLTWPTDAASQAQRRFVSELFAFRHAHPALRPRAFRDGKDHDDNGLPDVSWHRADGARADGGYLDDAGSAFLAFRLDGAEANDPAAALYVAYNGAPTPRDAILPGPPAGTAWVRVIDSATGPVPEAPVAENAYRLESRSVALFVAR